ncbi:MAG: hypothetical protein ACPGUD_09055 [Parashewanella sp.]
MKAALLVSSHLLLFISLVCHANATPLFPQNLPYRMHRTIQYDLANNFSKTPFPTSGKALCDELTQGNPIFTYCYVTLNTTNHELMMSVTYKNGNSNGIIPASNYEHEFENYDPGITNETIVNPENSKVIYNGVPKNWLGLICNETECKDWSGN